MTTDNDTGTDLRSDAESDLLHVEGTCPSCAAAIHIVVDSFASKARWCCVSCQVVGTMPWVLDPSVLQQPLAVRPPNFPRA